MCTRRLLTTAALLAVTLVASVLSLTPAQAKPAPPRPDLVVAAASTAAEVRQGATIAVTTVLRNAGRATAGRSALRFVLSRDTRVGADRALSGSRAVPVLRARRTSRATTRVTVPATTPVGTYHVLACADAARRVRESRETNNCRATRGLRVTVLPSSQELIEADVAAGRLGAEQALVYRVFADFGDRRLPARYAGRPDGLGEGALGELADGWAGLAPATQDVVRPFLVPPFYAGSHWSPSARRTAPPADPAGSARRAFDSPWCVGQTDVSPLYETWEHLDTPSGDVRIWWLRKNTGDAATATHYADILEHKILPRLTALMGHGLQPDGDSLCDGGSAALDIALVDASTATTYNDGSCGPQGTSSHILFPRDPAKVGWAGGDPYLAHEVMHSLQLAGPMAGSCDDYDWLMEMTAQWVQDFVTDPLYGVGLGPDDTEHKAASIFLDNPGVSFEVPDTPRHHDYSDYLLALWTARRSGPSFVTDIWDAAARLAPKQAVDAALPGGFADTWADFALSNWNQGPVDDYRQWDQLTAGAAVAGDIAVGPTRTQVATVPVKHLAAQYVEMTLDPKIKELEVTNDLAGQAGASMRAVLSYDDGSHRVVDLSTRATTVLCLDDGTKKVTRMVLVLANADLDADVSFKPTFKPGQTCGCPNATPLRRGADPAGPAAAPGPVCTGQGNIAFSWTEEVTDEGEITRTSQTSGAGTLDLVLQAGGPREARSNAPGSTYQFSETTRHQVRRGAPNGCGDEDGVSTRTGSGPMPEDAVFVYPDWRDDGTWRLSRLTALPLHWVFDNVTTCWGTRHDEQDFHLGLHTCAPTAPGTSASDWLMTPAAPGSDVFVIDCTGTVVFRGGDDREHTLTVTASGRIRLPR